MNDHHEQRTTSDASLLHRFQIGTDGDAATELYWRYAQRLRALAVAKTSDDLAQRIDPDDIVQSVFRTFFRRAAAGEYDVPDGDELWKLFLVIALNKVRAVAAHHKADKRDVRKTAPITATETDAVAQSSAEDELRELQLTIDELLAPLPEGHRRIITLRIAGHEVAEIAQAVGRSKRSVERILQEFRRSLSAVLDEPD